MEEIIAQGLVHFGDDESSVPCKKNYLTDNEYSTPYSVFYKDGRAATKRLRTLLGENLFQNPKDEDIIESIIDFSTTNKSANVLDFFAGFRVIIMTQANSQVNTMALELLPKFKIKKNESLVCCLERLLQE